jgi:hypothetical protein
VKNSDPYPLPAFVVFDPDCERWNAWRDALKDDHVEVESHRFNPDDPTDLPVYRLKASSLGSDQLTRICKMIARQSGQTEAVVLVEAIFGEGLPVPALGVFVCKDPDVGRGYFAGLGRKGGQHG